ncbi:hypothetical protein FF38_13897 [Lucilia cuprina]|uniref:Uncharacterized protein n=1 Tax=Lucilia cuprina TaxID=7375 RepID=A0A0L0BMM3_LUCCU|nr:hypothetical protein FF38_13897 [Lucilia cuprina]
MDVLYTSNLLIVAPLRNDVQHEINLNAYPDLKKAITGLKSIEAESLNISAFLNLFKPAQPNYFDDPVVSSTAPRDVVRKINQSINLDAFLCRDTVTKDATVPENSSKEVFQIITSILEGGGDFPDPQVALSHNPVTPVEMATVQRENPDIYDMYIPVLKPTFSLRDFANLINTWVLNESQPTDLPGQVLWKLTTNSTRLTRALFRFHVKSFQGKAEDIFDITIL